MNIPDDTEESVQINIVPMIDVIFAILTFFIMASLFLTRSEGLPVNLPRAATAQEQQQSKIAVTIDADGNVFVNREQTPIEQLTERVSTLKNTANQALVVIQADETVDHGQVVQVMDALRTIEGVRLGIATRRPE